MLRPSHSSRFFNPNSIGLGVQIIQFLIMPFSPLLCYLVPLRPKYSPTHPHCKTDRVKLESTTTAGIKT